MANKINKPLCATEFGNTGFGDCFLEPAKFAGAIQVPSNFAVTEADVATLQDFLTNKITAAIGTRIIPYHNFISVNDNSEDLSITTTDYGAKYITREGFYDWTYRYLQGGVQLHQNIQKNQGSNKYFLFYDDNGVIYGYKKNGTLTGILVDIFHANPWKIATGADVPQYLLRYIINPKYLNGGNLGFIPTGNLGFNMFDILGIQDVTIELVSTASNVSVVKAFTSISNVDLHDVYAAALSRTTAWAAVNNFGNPVQITSVVDNPTAGGWTITFLSGNWNASDTVSLSLTTAALLAASPISMVGYECVEPLVIEAPAS